MANVISDETIDYVGILAKLELSDEEKEKAKKDMEEMLDYIDKLAMCCRSMPGMSQESGSISCIPRKQCVQGRCGYKR